MERRLARKLVALAAAYAVALNALLPVLAALVPPASGGAFGLEVICSAGAAGERGVPEKPQPLGFSCAACAMPGCAATVLPDVASSGAAAARVRAETFAPGRDIPRRQAFWRGGSKLARGPPVA